MKITQLYNNLNAHLIDLQDNQERKQVQVDQCNDYFYCVKRNSHLVDQYKMLSNEISQNFIYQHFDTNTLSFNFKRLETIDSKIHDLQSSLPDIRRYMKNESGTIEQGMLQYANDLNFERMNDTEQWIDSILYDLERIKQERRDNIEKWKSVGKAIIKFVAVAVGSVFKFFWKMINNK